MKYTKSMGSGVWCWAASRLGFLSSFCFGVDPFISPHALALDELDEGGLPVWAGQGLP